MRKKISAIILVCLIALLTCALVACNTDGSKFVNDVPVEIGENVDAYGNQTQELDGGYASVRFSFTKEMSSVFNLVVVDPNEGYDVSTINYSVIYTKGAITNVTPDTPLSIDYIDGEDLPLLKQKGHHTIHVSIPYAGTILKSSFALHLRYAYDEVEYVTLSFSTNGGTPHFATATDNKVSIRVENGLTFTYDEFNRNFTITKQDQAIQYFAVEGNSIKKLQRTISKGDSSTTSNQITITGDTKFVVNWTANTVNVKFTIIAPKDEKGNTVSPSGQVPTIDSQSVERSVGTIVRPIVEMNVYDGFYFAGWYDKATDRVWNFTNPVGEDNIELYSKWTTRYYSFSLYTMSGTFKSGLTDSVVGGVSLDSIDVAKKKGFLVAESIVSFSSVTGYPIRIDVSGLSYGAKYSDYVTELQIDAKDSSKTIVMVLSDLFKAFEKPIDSDILNDKIVADNSFYTSLSCREEDAVSGTAMVGGNAVLYVKWELDVEPSDTDYDEVISEYFTELLFKGALKIKSDGSIAITDIVDQTFAEIAIPDSIFYEGKDRYISEFSSKSMMNVRSLGLLDLSKAAHLETIGSEAFVNCNSLYNIIWPENNNISSIGRRAFANTNWENEFEYDFIVINDILYKYIDKSNKDTQTFITTLDLSVDKYYSYPDESEYMDADEYEAVKVEIDALNNALKNVTIISEEAFESGTYLEKVTLPGKVVEIGDKAFANLEELVYVDAPNTLIKVSVSAFDGTKLISAAYTATDDDNNTIQLSAYTTETKYEAVKVGNVLVRMIDVDAKDIIIPYELNIIAFAEEAFMNCKNLDTIVFTGGSDALVQYIGANAFAASLGYINKEEKKGFTVINGILAEYYNTNRFDTSIVIGHDTGATTIGEYAFNSYARHVETVEIGADVEKILNYAFAGATNLRGILFSNVTLVNDRLYNLPEIESLSFASSKGELINGINLYFYQSAYDYLNGLTSTKLNEIYQAALAETTEYARTSAMNYYYKLLDWYNLFTMNNNYFKVEKIEKVYINTDVIKSLYVISDFYSWSTVASLDTESKGVILQTSAGVKKYEKFEAGTFSAAFAHETEGPKTAEINKKEDWNDATLIPFEYKVVYAVKGEPYSFYDSKNKATIVSGNTLTSSGVFWVTGFEGDITTGDVPIFYTSKATLDVETIKLNYKTNKDSIVHEIVASEYSDFAPNANTASTIYFMFNFNGAGYYRVAFNYKGVESKVKKIEQANPISIPLNANVSEALNKATVYYYGEDLSKTEEYIDMNEFDIYSVNGNTDVLSLISNTLGLNTIELKYRGSKKVTSDLEDIIIVYSVVLEGDASQFVFEIKSGGAVITTHRNSSVETLVIPSSYVKGGIEYDVTEIADGVFSNYSKLTTVYLPSTIKRIGATAFKNCAQLKNVFSSESTENTKTHIADSNFDIISKEVTEYGTINVSKVDLTSGTLVIPNTLVVESTNNEGGIDVKTTSYVSPIFDPATFKKFFGVIYFDYTESNFNFVKDNLLDAKEIEVVFMFNSSEEAISHNTDKIEFLQYTDANKTFVNSQKNPKDNAGNDINMYVNYIFYYVVSDSQPRMSSTTQRHFTYDATSITVTSKEVYQTRKLKSLFLDDSSITTIVVGDIYVKEETVKGVAVTTTSKTVATVDEITVNIPEFVVYLPDTIFNTCVIKNNSSEAQQVIVYKHGQELLYSTNNYVSASIEYIGNGAFESCVSLGSIDLSMATNLEDLGAGAFSKSGIASIDLSKTKITEINSQTFQDCTLLESATLSSLTTYIGAYAFDGCVKLTLTKEFFTNIKSIASCAFTRCDALVNIDLTASTITTISANAFSNSAASIKVSFAAANKPAGWENAWNGFCSVIYSA